MDPTSVLMFAAVHTHTILTVLPHTCSAELHERISKVDKLRKRYEILSISMAPPEDGEEHSQAYYVIKAAQEREEFQREGDELDSKIKKAEREIR